MNITIDLKNYRDNKPIFKRTASRAIITLGNKYLFIYSKYGDYKFPGGGMNEGESLVDTLIREVSEETGYVVISDSIRKYGQVFERRKGENDNILVMESHYFFCDVENLVGVRNLDLYEADYDYRIVWLTLSEAIRRNKQVDNIDSVPWVIRDTKVMENLLYEEYIKNIPESMATYIKGHSFETDSIGCSFSNIFIFDNDLVLKVEEKRDESDGEYLMMKWLNDKLPVPKIVDFYTDGVTNYLLMTKLNGKMACDIEIMDNCEKMVRLYARGLKRLWQVDIEGCPRIINIDYKLNRALSNIHNEPSTYGVNGFKNPMELYEYLRDNKPEEKPVLIHGDYCLPNLFIENNQISGYLDLGYCGIGDKWQDIALAVRSIRHNLEDIGRAEGFLSLYKIFFEELGIEPEDDKINYYILLDELF